MIMLVTLNNTFILATKVQHPALFYFISAWPLTNWVFHVAGAQMWNTVTKKLFIHSLLPKIFVIMGSCLILSIDIVLSYIRALWNGVYWFYIPSVVMFIFQTLQSIMFIFCIYINQCRWWLQLKISNNKYKESNLLKDGVIPAWSQSILASFYQSPSKLGVYNYCYAGY